MAPRKIIVDTDPAIGYRFRDVDDALALLYLLSLPEEFDVIGITAVFGNAPLSKTYPKALEVVETAGRKGLPVLPGADGRHSLGHPADASRFLASAVRSDPGEVTVLAIGPLTNVGTAGICDPEFYANLRELVVVGGTLSEGMGFPLTSSFEFNFFKDPGATGLVLQARCDRVLITADLCKQAIFTDRELKKLEGMSGPVAGYLAAHIPSWLALNEKVLMRGAGGFVPWDVVAAVFLRRPDLFGGFEEAPLALRHGFFRGGGLKRRPGDVTAAKLPTLLDGKGMMSDFIEVIAATG